MRPDPATDSLIGAVLGGRYRLIRRIGKGGMGVVYEADHLGIGKRVAIKLLLDKYTDDPEVIARFQREAHTASSIGDRHIVEVFDAGVTDDGRSYLVMELLIGASLADIAQATGPMPAGRAIPIIRQVLRGLGAAHAKGIVHRDMKPENVFLLQDPDPDFVKIMDFGISKFITDRESKVRLTATGAVIGTPVYMAPEQAMGTGEIDARVDLYAVGVMLYELLAGRPPFEAPTYIALVTQHLSMPPPPLQLARPDLPTALVVAVHRALEKDPAARFASAAVMAAALPDEHQLASLDGVATLSGAGRPPGDRGLTAPGNPRGRAARAAATPGNAAAPTTSKRPGAAPMTTTRLRRWPWQAGLVAAAAAIGATVVVVALRPGKQPVPVAAPAAPASSLEVVTDPAGAAVEIDGVPRGTTPVVVAGLASGIHEVKLTRDGYTPMVLRKAVRDGRDETLSAALSPATQLEPAARDPRGTPRPASQPQAKQPATQPRPQPGTPPKPEPGTPPKPEPGTPPKPEPTTQPTPQPQPKPPPKTTPKDPYSTPEVAPPDRKASPFG